MSTETIPDDRLWALLAPQAACSPDEVQQGEIKVLFTGEAETRVALESAARLAGRLNARVSLLVLQTVPRPLEPERSPLPIEFLRERMRELADAAQLSSLADETPEGRSIVVLAKEKYNLRGCEVSDANARFIPFSAYTRMSGVDLDGRRLRKDATDAIKAFVAENGGSVPAEFTEVSDRISRGGGTPMAVADGARPLGVVNLKDIVKGGIRDRLAQLRRMSIRSVMVTGDNPLTAAAISEEAGVDDFLAQATPKDKLEYIRREQAHGRLVAMAGDGTNDAPALAQADVGVAMNSGTMAAKEAGNMVDLDNNPTKLIEIVAIGKQLLITRGALPATPGQACASALNSRRNFLRKEGY